MRLEPKGLGCFNPFYTQSYCWVNITSLFWFIASFIHVFIFTLDPDEINKVSFSLFSQNWYPMPPFWKWVEHIHGWGGWGLSRECPLWRHKLLVSPKRCVLFNLRCRVPITEQASEVNDGISPASTSSSRKEESCNCSQLQLELGSLRSRLGLKKICENLPFPCGAVVNQVVAGCNKLTHKKTLVTNH